MERSPTQLFFRQPRPKGLHNIQNGLFLEKILQHTAQNYTPQIVKYFVMAHLIFALIHYTFDRIKYGYLVKAKINSVM